MERKPYYILRMKKSSFILREGKVGEVCPNSARIQLYLTDEEVQKYDNKRVIEVLKPYFEIVKKRSMYIPPELLFYAICEVLYA